MPRLIDANVFECVCVNGKSKDFCNGVLYVLDMIDAQPTIDAVEVVHGEWVQIGYDKAMDRITCSVCKEYWNICDNDTESFNYCPNCGAKMDGDS